jgi:hypothetical protein
VTPPRDLQCVDQVTGQWRDRTPEEIRALEAPTASEPFVEFGIGWAKIHFRREVTDRDRAILASALASMGEERK